MGLGSSGRVEARFEIVGDDKSSKALKAAKSNMADVRKEMRSTAKASGDLGDSFADAGDQSAQKAGKLSTALSSLGDFAGHSEGQFRSASEAAGAFDDVLTVMPGPIGLAAGAVIGLTTVLYLNAKASREATEKLTQAFGPEVAERLNEIRDKLDVSSEAMIEYQKAIVDTDRTAFLLDGQLKKVVADAEAIGEDGSEAIKRFAAELRASATDAQLLAGEARRLKIEVDALKPSENLTGERAQQYADALKTARHELGQLAKLEKQGEDVAGRRNELIARLASVQTLIRNASAGDVAAAGRKVDLINAELIAAAKLVALGKRRAASAKARARTATRAAARAKRDADDLKLAAEALDNAEASFQQTRTARLQTLNEEFDVAIGYLDQLDGRYAKQAETAKAARAAAKADLAEYRADLGAAASALQFSAPGGDNEISQVFASMSSSAAEAVQQFGTVEKAAPDALSKIGAAGGAFVKNEKLRAGIMAAVSLADAFRAGAVGNVAGAALFGSAAVQYGLVAGGVLGGSSSGSSGSTGASPLSGSGAATAGAEAASSRVVNVTFNGVFATRAQTASALAELGSELDGTGL